MTALLQLPFVFVVLVMLCVFVTGIYVSCRGLGMCSHETLREVLMWGGGFVIYAVFDYFILMH